MRNGFWIFLASVIFIEVYSFFGVKQLIHNWSPQWKSVINWGWWLPILISTALMFYLGSQRDKLEKDMSYTFFFFCVGFAVTCFLPKIVFAVFHLINDLVNVVRWVGHKISPPSDVAEGLRLSRFQFFNQLGLAAGAFTMGSMIYGMTRGKYNFRIEEAQPSFADLPRSFHGVRIVQVSDFHLGSFGDNSFEEVKHAVERINELRPDYVFFTGDMVNFFATEAEPWIEILSGIRAESGKFSILGNHDYADYYNWNGDDAGKQANLDRLKEIHGEMGFDLILNDHRIIERGDDRITLLGMENWGHGFQKYGDLPKTMTGVDPTSFKILLSHDPTHFEKQVMGMENIHLTLSGHTHGAQLGVEIPSMGIHLSPSRLMYRRWAGLYQEGDQYLYVNRGFGFLGFPGRVGMPPEITLLELQKA